MSLCISASLCPLDLLGHAASVHDLGLPSLLDHGAGSARQHAEDVAAARAVDALPLTDGRPLVVAHDDVHDRDEEAQRVDAAAVSKTLGDLTHPIAWC